MRLDVYLVERAYFDTRTRAQDAIGEGRVQVDGKVIIKNSFVVEDSMQIKVEEAQLTLASRAGFKLYDALIDFQITLDDRICIDVGASTGGFSDVCLRFNAAFVYAVDVGKDQLLPFLKEDKRIKNIENCNCRYLKREMFDPLPNFACMDVSFISIKLILPSLIAVMEHCEMVILIKPQFEAGRANVGKNGIIKDDKVHIQVLRDILDFVESLGLYVHHLQVSSVLGRDGNKEFVMHVRDIPTQQVFSLKQIVSEKHSRR